MSEMEKEINEILGYGEELKVLVGVDSETGEKLIKKYHFTPVALKDIPMLLKLLDVFFKASDTNSWDESVIEKSSKIIKMALVKMHPDIDEKEIQKNFGLGALAKGISIVMDINDFLSQMQVMTQKLNVISQAKTEKKNQA